MKLVNNDVHLMTKTMLSCEWGINKNFHKNVLKTSFVIIYTKWRL